MFLTEHQWDVLFRNVCQWQQIITKCVAYVLKDFWI